MKKAWMAGFAELLLSTACTPQETAAPDERPASTVGAVQATPAPTATPVPTPQPDLTYDEIRNVAVYNSVPGTVVEGCFTVSRDGKRG